jgi:hypothetical protein
MEPSPMQEVLCAGSRQNPAYTRRANAHLFGNLPGRHPVRVHLDHARPVDNQPWPPADAPFAARLRQARQNSFPDQFPLEFRKLFLLCVPKHDIRPLEQASTDCGVAPHEYACCLFS